MDIIDWLRQLGPLKGFFVIFASFAIILSPVFLIGTSMFSRDGRIPPSPPPPPPPKPGKLAPNLPQEGELMPREKPAYRDNLEDLLGYFEGRRVVTISDVSRYTGHSRKWVKQKYPFDSDGYISLPTLARALS